MEEGENGRFLPPSSPFLLPISITASSLSLALLIGQSMHLLPLIPALLIATTTQSQPASMAGRSVVYAPNGMIATSQPLATTAGLQVLQNGGNAIDAAVTAAIVLSVTEPHMTGLGGDLFAIIWSAKDQKLYGLNASGRSGSLMTREELVKRERRSISGIEAVTVPGALS